jgi:hypothetical protein
MPFDGTYQDMMAKHGFIPANHEQPKFFHVEARRLYDEKGVELDGWRRIYNADLDKTLHVATDRYELVTNEDAYGAFEDGLKKSSLDLTDMQLGTDFSAFGARCFRQYVLPAHMVRVKPGVDVALRFIMLNSYDGSTRFKGMSGAYNFVCANTSIMGKDYASFSFVHRGAIDLETAVAGLVKAAEEHVQGGERWSLWPRIAISDQQAISACKALPGTLGGGHGATPKSTIDHLVHAYLTARDTDGVQGGPNLWTLYNVFTAWSTHGEVLNVEGGLGQAKFDRERRVAALLDTKAWKALEAA